MSLRLRAAPLAMVAVAILLAACSSTPEHHVSGGSSSTSTTAPSTTTAPSSSAPSTSSPPSTSAAAATCSTGILQIAAVGVATSAGTSRLTFSLTNGGPQPCSLKGYPTVTLYGPSGAGGAGAGSKLQIGDIQLAAPAKTVLLAPSYAAQFVVSVAEVPVNGAACSTVASIQVNPPGSSESVSLPDSFQACGTSVGVSPITATPPPG